MAFDCTKAPFFNLKPQIMYLITFETSSYYFCYVSKTETLVPLRKAWEKHSQQMQADPQHLERNLDAVKILKLEFNQVFRDFEPFS